MAYVRPKKFLGQHFLKDEGIAERIAEAVPETEGSVLEIGPGTGILTGFLDSRFDSKLFLIEIDRESVSYLKEHFPHLKPRIIEGDFLTLPVDPLPAPVSVVGNFPYYISSQILFRVIELRDQVSSLTGMFQKEMAERIVAPPGSRTYGIPSVLAQAFFSAEYLFTVDEHVFSPPPKVKSGVIRLVNKNIQNFPCDIPFFFTVVKTAFNQRRKTLRNALKPLMNGCSIPDEPMLDKRAEQLSVENFISLTLKIFQFHGKTTKD